MKTLLKYAWILLSVAAVSCVDDPEPPLKARTLMMYMFDDGGGSISSYFEKNVEDVVSHWSDDYGGNVVIYLDPSGGAPRLIDVRPDGEGGFAQRVVREYEEMNSASAETFAQVVADMKELYPAESYGLIWGAHADAWISKDGFYHDMEGGRALRMSLDDNLSAVRWESARSFGIDGSDHMDVADMAEALGRAFPEGLDFLLWDACFMSSAEVLYELRGMVRYVVASCTETPIAGYPYGEMLPYLWGTGTSLAGGLSRLCDIYKAYYEGKDGSFGTVALLDLDGMDGLLEACRSIVGGRLDEVRRLSKDAVYRYPLVDYSRQVFYDLGDYMRVMGLERPADGQDEQQAAAAYARFEQALGEVVLHKAKVDPFRTSGDIPDDCFSGINVFVPCDAWDYGDYYDTLSWNAVYDKIED